MTQEEYGRKIPRLGSCCCWRRRGACWIAACWVNGGASLGISNKADVQGGASAKEKKGWSDCHCACGRAIGLGASKNPWKGGAEKHTEDHSSTWVAFKTGEKVNLNSFHWGLGVFAIYQLSPPNYQNVPPQKNPSKYSVIISYSMQLSHHPSIWRIFLIDKWKLIFLLPPLVCIIF